MLKFDEALEGLGELHGFEGVEVGVDEGQGGGEVGGGKGHLGMWDFWEVEQSAGGRKW